MDYIEIEFKHYYYRECKKCGNRIQTQINSFNMGTDYVRFPVESCIVCGEVADEFIEKTIQQERA